MAWPALGAQLGGGVVFEPRFRRWSQLGPTCAGGMHQLQADTCSQCRNKPLLESQQNVHAGSRARVTIMGGLYDAATLHALQKNSVERTLTP